MRLDYDQIARGYDYHRQGGGPYLDTLVRLLERSPGRRVLELGAGTGNNTGAVHDAVPCHVTALEPSQGMLDKARGKGVPAHWVRGCATDLPFAAHAFDFLFATYVLHHIADLEALLRECVRVLDGGGAAFVTAPLSFIARHPMNDYFPSFAAVDLARFQPIEEILDSMECVGFRHVGAARHQAEPRPLDAAYVQKVAGKFISTFDLLPPGEFEAGLERLRADVAANQCLGKTITWEAVTVWGFQ